MSGDGYGYAHTDLIPRNVNHTVDYGNSSGAVSTMKIQADKIDELKSEVVSLRKQFEESIIQGERIENEREKQRLEVGDLRLQIDKLKFKLHEFVKEM